MVSLFPSPNLSFGPLRYQLLAHDAWGKAALVRLGENLDCITFSAARDRIIHLLDFRPDAQERKEMFARLLPARLAQVLPDPELRQGWRATDDDTAHACWMHPDTSQVIWTFGIATAHYEASFQLPWQPIFADIVQRDGGLMHSGLVLLGNRGYLVTAPPSGGKTTALYRLPPPWRVLSDDAALVWPDPDGGFWASPLPTWGVLVRTARKRPVAGRWQVATACPVGGTVVLHKAEQEKMHSLAPIAAAPHLYRAFSEHPRVLASRQPWRKKLFLVACELARATPCWELELTRSGNYWDLFRDAFARA